MKEPAFVLDEVACGLFLLTRRLHRNYADPLNTGFHPLFETILSL